MNDPQKIMTQLERIEHLLRCLWEDQQLDRIEDHVRHIRYGDGQAVSDPLKLLQETLEKAAIYGVAFTQDGKVLNSEDVFAKPAPASQTDQT